MSDLYDNPFADDPPPSTDYGAATDDYTPYGQATGGVDVTTGFNYGNFEAQDDEPVPQPAFAQTYAQYNQPAQQQQPMQPQEDYAQSYAPFTGGYATQQNYQQNYQQPQYEVPQPQNDQTYGQTYQQPQQSQSQDLEASATAVFEQRRDSLVARLSQSKEASFFPKHKSFSKEDSPYSEIRITDPEKVADYTVYKLVATSKDGNNCYTQQRRYQHFEWLYSELTNKYPGVVIPPIPEKRIFGRFEPEFVEARRFFLEVFLKKINKHPILMGSEDFRSFVHSMKPEELIKKESKGLMSLVGGVFSDASPAFLKSGPDDKWHETKKADIIKLEAQLRKLQRKVETIVKQRKELGTTVASFWNDISSIKDESDVFDSLAQLGTIQLKVEEVHQRESAQYVMHFGYTVDLYIRMIESVKNAMNTRATCSRMAHLAEDALQKKKDKLEKAMGQMDKGDLVSQIVQEVDQAQKEVDLTKKNFNEIDQITQSELERFEKEMKEDFQGSMKEYVLKMVEAQEEVTKWWSEYLPQMNSS